MPQYCLSWREYRWPGYQNPGEGELNMEIFKALNNDAALKRARKISDRYRGHQDHQANEQDYKADFELVKIIKIKLPTRVPK